MMTSPNENIFRVTCPLCGEFTGHWWIPRTKAIDAELLMLSLICARTNGWLYNGDSGDLRRHRAHYDVTVMIQHLFCWETVCINFTFRSQVTSQYLNQWCLSLLTHICDTRPRWVLKMFWKGRQCFGLFDGLILIMLMGSASHMTAIILYTDSHARSPFFMIWLR